MDSSVHNHAWSLCLQLVGVWLMTLPCKSFPRNLPAYHWCRGAPGHFSASPLVTNPSDCGASHSEVTCHLLVIHALHVQFPLHGMRPYSFPSFFLPSASGYLPSIPILAPNSLSEHHSMKDPGLHLGIPYPGPP